MAGLDDFEADSTLGGAGSDYDDPPEWHRGMPGQGFAGPAMYAPAPEPILSDRAARNFSTALIVLGVAMILRALRR